MSETISAPAPGSPLRRTAGEPLRRHIFRALLLATLVSNIGGWMADVGATWFMTSLRGSPLMVALVQGFGSLPVFLLALPAGTLADIVDRRALLLGAQAWMFVVALLLSALALTGHLGPWGLLACVFALGVGAALDGPASQAVVADVVPRGEVARAASLNGVALTIGRVAGPALGGFVVAWSGPGATFVLNALSFVVVIIALWRLKRPHHESLIPAERVWTGMRTGLRYVRGSPTLRALLARTFAVLVPASALWALLPSFVSRSLAGSSYHYGLLLTSLGMGAVATPPLVTRIRARYGVDAVLIPATLLLAVGVGGLAACPSIAWASLATMLSGAAWMAIVVTSIATAQKASATWVQARALAVYLLVSEGALGAGSILWGWLAARTSIRLAIGVASAGVAGSALVALLRRLRDVDRVDRSPSGMHPIPPPPQGIDRERTPVIVEVVYRVEKGKTALFRGALAELGASRRRTGAALWVATVDSQDASRFVELFLLESWNEHHRQHARWTQFDEGLWSRLLTMLVPGTAPAISHLLQTAAHGRRSLRSLALSLVARSSEARHPRGRRRLP